MKSFYRLGQYNYFLDTLVNKKCITLIKSDSKGITEDFYFKKCFCFELSIKESWKKSIMVPT